MTRLLLLTLLLGIAPALADQTGAEAVKTPASATITGARTIANWEGDPIGNVQVVYKDGTKDQWTLKGNASNPKVFADGTVGWVLSPLAEDGKTLDLYKNLPTFPRLRIVRAGKVLATLDAERPFIEDWGFSDAGTFVIIKSRGAHGPAFVQRFRISDGSAQGRTPAFGDDLPGWAEPYAD